MSGVQKVDDPGLPPPWQALFDPASGLKYYWNPSSNVTTYQRPAGGPAPPPSPPKPYADPGSYSRVREGSMSCDLAQLKTLLLASSRAVAPLMVTVATTEEQATEGQAAGLMAARATTEEQQVVATTVVAAATQEEATKQEARRA